MAITILDYLKTVAGDKDTYTDDEYFRHGAGTIGHCERCAATLASHNAYPSTSGHWRCANCIGTTGFATVDDFLASCAESVAIHDDDTGDTDLVLFTCPDCGGVEDIRHMEDHSSECGVCGSVWH